MVKMQYRKTRVQRETSTIGDCFCSTGYRLVSWVRLSVCGLVFIQLSSAAQSCLTLCKLMDCCTPDFPVLHQLLEFAQTHIHWVKDAMQPSHPLSSPSPPAFNLSQHPMSQFFTSGGHSIGASASASVLPINIQGWFPLGLTSFQFSSVTQSCPTLCDPMDCSTPGLPVHHQLPESTQTHVHGVGDAIQPSHPLSSPSPPALNLSQHQGLFKWVRSLHQVAKVLEFQLQYQSYQWTPRTDLL